MKAMILPGNGGCTQDSFWYASVAEALQSSGVDAILEDMPDAVLARRKFWVPFVEAKLEDDDCRVLVGHSSGTVAALRYLEKNTAELAVLVAVYHTDLGIEEERISGYFDDPWQWNRIKRNTGRILIFASKDDPFIPIEEPRFVRDRLFAEYVEFENRGHFMDDAFPELVDAVILAARDDCDD